MTDHLAGPARALAESLRPGLEQLAAALPSPEQAEALRRDVAVGVRALIPSPEQVEAVRAELARGLAGFLPPQPPTGGTL
ncbi:hypothetical protein [Microbispora sp. CA-102843]|uniref:hypothetical protein n=1 Tax=Microbispora sp. CA-102843 TaxID=3239952 RepID=UPI003D948EA5